MSYLGLGTRDRVWSEKSQLCVLWTVEIAWIDLNSLGTWDLGPCVRRPFLRSVDGLDCKGCIFLSWQSEEGMSWVLELAEWKVDCHKSRCSLQESAALLCSLSGCDARAAFLILSYWFFLIISLTWLIHAVSDFVDSSQSWRRLTYSEDLFGEGAKGRLWS